MRPLTLAALLAAFVAFSTAATAQDSGGIGGRRHGMMRGGGQRMSPPDPVILKGPPVPDSLAQIVTLKDPQREQYATLHQRFMTSTQPQRDSLRAVSERLREDWTNRDRVAGREHMGTARQLRDALSRQQETFDESLKGLLDKDQWGKYEQWRDQERKRAASEWKEKMKSRGM